MANNTHDDSEFNAYLHGQSPLSVLYQQTTATGPSAATDTAILAAAQAAVKKRGGPVSPFSYRWMVPTSLAAVIVLSVTIVVLSDHEQEIVLPQSAPAPSVAAPEIQEKIIAEDRLAKQEPLRKDKNDTRTRTNELQAAITTPASSAANSTPSAAIIAPDEQQVKQEEVRNQKPDDFARLTTPEHIAELKAKQAEAVPALEQTAATSPNAPVVGTESPVIVAEKPLAQGYVTSSDNLARKKLKDQRQAAAGSSPLADSDKKQLSENKRRDKSNLGTTVSKLPETWLNEITILLKAGKETQARDELKAFRKIHASFTIDARRYPEVNKLNTLLEQEKHHD